MEEYGRERIPADSIDRYVDCVDEATFLQFTSSGFRLFQYLKKDEPRNYTIEIGNWQASYSDSDLEPVLISEASDIDGLYSPFASDPEVVQGDDFNHIDDKRYLEWKSHLVSPAEVIKAAKAELTRRETGGDEVFVTCTDCEGELRLELECTCMEERRSDSENIFNIEDLLAGAEDISLVDPDCEHCHGTGARFYDCPTCEGCGKMCKYPFLILANEVTHEKREIKLDLAAMIINDEVEVSWVGSEHSDRTGFQSSNHFMLFRVSPYIHKNFEELGLDPANSARTFEDRIVIPNAEDSDIPGLYVSWFKSMPNGFVRTIESPGGSKRLKPSDVLEEAQLTLAKVHAQSEAGLKNEDGIVVGQYWLLRPLRAAEETLQDLITALDMHNFSLGLTIDPVNEAQPGPNFPGPTFYIMDRSGTPLYPLGGNVDPRASLENAWLNLQHIFSQSFNSD